MEDRAMTAKVETIRLMASNGRPIRLVTKVTLGDGRVVTFTERMSNRAALAQAHRAAR